MSAEMTRTVGHLSEHRGTIVVHAIGAAISGLLPIPYVDEWLPSLIRRAMIHKIAAARGVDVDAAAVSELADGRVPPPKWSQLVSLGAFARSARRSVRRLFMAFVVYRRAEAASRTFVVGTLFDHYCARLHVGAGLDGPAGRALRARIDQVAAARPGSLGAFLFRRGMIGALRASARAPIELFHALTAGKLRRDNEVQAEEEVESALEAAAHDERSFLGRAAAAVDRQLGGAGSEWIAGLVEAFERTR
jgi:hypothetical protein